MSRTTKILLAISLIGFSVGCTDFLWGVGKPIGAIFLGLFLISKLLEKEVALFDQEEQERFARGQRASAPNGARQVKQVETGRPGLTGAAWA